MMMMMMMMMLKWWWWQWYQPAICKCTGGEGTAKHCSKRGQAHLMFFIFSIMMMIRNLMMMMFAPTTQLAVSGSRPSLHMDLRLAKAKAVSSYLYWEILSTANITNIGPFSNWIECVLRQKTIILWRGEPWNPSGGPGSDKSDLQVGKRGNQGCQCLRDRLALDRDVACV